MRRSPADSTNRSLAAFGKLQHIRIKRRSRAPASGTLLAGESFTITVLIGRDLNRRQPPRARGPSPPGELAAEPAHARCRVGLGEAPHTAELYRERLTTVRIPVESDH